MKYTHKTSEGSLARVLCDDLVGGCNCAVAILVGGAEIVRIFHKDSDGSIRNTNETLKEISPWDDVAVDTPIWVRETGVSAWQPRHFAKFDSGNVYFWANGTTSHSCKRSLTSLTYWPYATLENPNGN